MQEAHFKEIMEELKKLYPSTDKTTLNRMRTKPDPFKVLISCLLSLRARDENTEKVSNQLFQVVNTPEQLVKIPLSKLEKIIFSSGHYKKKARVLQSVSNELITRFNSKVPDKKEDLLSIKGIGPKTANIVLAFAFNQPVIPVDTHVHRIPNRIGWIKTKKPEQTEQELMKILPKIYWADVNAIFVQFGRDICQPVSPKCSTCPINKYCKKIGIERRR